MECQLALQFAPWGHRTFDDLVALEEHLEAIEDLRAEVDGHDLGSDEANIFLFADDPSRTFTHCLPAIRAAGLVSVLSAAYRKTGEDEYIRIWPVDDTAPFEIR
jgi:hypothetical protein